MNQYIVSVGAFTDAFKSEDLGYDHFCLTVVFFCSSDNGKELICSLDLSSEDYHQKNRGQGR